jgi:uncharacterized protein (DUF2141 family)
MGGENAQNAFGTGGLMKRITAVFALFMAFNVMTAASELTVTLEITGVKINGGDVYIAVYDSAKASQAEEPYAKFRHDPDSGVISIETRLSEGFYQVSVFQDENGNGSLDTGLFGIPKEPFGMSNYTGRGIPGSFDKLKIWVGLGTGKVSVNLGYYKF